MATPPVAPNVQAPAPQPGPLKRRLPALGIAVGGAAVLGVAALWTTSSVTSGSGTCVFRKVTGLPCPGCGLTRSFVMLAHGDVGSAFDYNLMGPVLFVLLAASVALAVWVLVSGRSELLTRWSSVVFSKGALVVVGVWLGYGVARMVSAGAGLDWFPLIT